MQANRPVIDLWAAPGGQKRVSQLLFGEAFDITATRGAYSFGRAPCGYQGWALSAALAQARTPTHHVQALATYVYARPDIKSETRLRLPYGAKLQVRGQEGAFFRVAEGYIFSADLGTAPARDFVSEAGRFLGVPYLWGGRSSLGVDCSGLVQLALSAAGIPAPRDSGPQSESLGTACPPDTPPERGDLVFWPGHVGLMQDSRTLLHATAHAMAVISEPLATAVARIKAQSLGEITMRRRL